MCANTPNENMVLLAMLFQAHSLILLPTLYAIKCQQCLSALYISRKDQSLHKIINRHRSVNKNHNNQKPVGEYFNPQGHPIANLRAAGKVQREITA